MTAPPDLPATHRATGRASAAQPVPGYAHRLSWGMAAWQRLKREPALAVTLAYLLVALIGVWSSYWYYRAFRIDILDYFQAGDFVVAGLRDPPSFGFLGLMLLVAAASYAPVAFWLRDPERVALLREQRWWARAIFWPSLSPFRARRWYDLSPEVVVLAGLVLGGGSMLMARAADRAAHIAIHGRPLEVTLAGATRPLLGEARLLGTSSAYVFLYWPGNGRSEALPQQAILRMEWLPRRPLRGGKATPAPASTAVDASPASPASRGQVAAGNAPP